MQLKRQPAHTPALGPSPHSLVSARVQGMEIHMLKKENLELLKEVSSCTAVGTGWLVFGWALALPRMDQSAARELRDGTVGQQPAAYQRCARAALSHVEPCHNEYMCACAHRASAPLRWSNFASEPPSSRQKTPRSPACWRQAMMISTVRRNTRVSHAVLKGGQKNSARVSYAFCVGPSSRMPRQ